MIRESEDSGFECKICGKGLGRRKCVPMAFLDRWIAQVEKGVEEFHIMSPLTIRLSCGCTRRNVLANPDQKPQHDFMVKREDGYYHTACGRRMTVKEVR